MITEITSITNAQIRQIEWEASMSGNRMLVRVCGAALAPDDVTARRMADMDRTEARRVCAEAINAARAMAG